jgi:hypothetical protein
MKRIAISACLLLLATGARAEEAPPSHTRRSLIRAGAITLGVAYAIPFAFGLRFDEPELFIPVAGPLVDLRRCRDCTASGVEKAVITALVVDGLVQAAGATLLAVGLARHEPERRVSVAPTRLASGFGVVVFGRF